MRVEILYARPGSVWRRNVELPEGATLGQALEASGLLNDFPEFREAPPAAGVFGRACPPQHVLRPGDRVEIYRPLEFDPMESRRRRVRHRERKAASRLS